MSQTLSLYRLQHTDSQIDKAQASLRAVQKALADDATLRSIIAQAEAAQEKHSSSGRISRQAENAVRDQRLKIEQAESSLYSGNVRNPKELQDLQNDVVALKRHLAVLEERQLEAMIASEEAESEHAEAQQALQAARMSQAEQNQNLSHEQAVFIKEIARLKTERQAIAGAVSGSDLILYEQLRGQKGGVAVAGITDNACAVCGSVLTPALQQAARSTSQIVRCSSCSRILYGG